MCGGLFDFNTKNVEAKDIEIKEVNFLISVVRQDQLPDSSKPEYAFIGRSNVGKSSLINMLMRKKNLAHTSSAPGKTRTINLFEVDNTWLLADLPGYGFAKTSHVQREEFKKMITYYLTKRANLMNVFLLIDSRLEPQKSDLEQIENLAEHQIPFCIVFTKSDKLSQSQLAKNMAVYEAKLSENWEELPKRFYTSAEKGNGRQDVLRYILEMNAMSQADRG
jgi:GTP-binding protein